jgi:hypothetical protein
MRLLLALLAASALACSSSSSSSAPTDAGQSCTPSSKPELTCQPGPADSNSCIGDDPNDKTTANQTVGFALGCRALYKDQRCQVTTACTCSQTQGSSGGSHVEWSCL